jgi:ArsR family transcriptional regulator
MKGKKRKEDLRTPLSIFKAIADDNRLRIVDSLRHGEASAQKLMESLDITQPTLSHHMKILSDAGLIMGRRYGRCTHYSLIHEGMDLILQYLAQLKISMNTSA